MVFWGAITEVKIPNEGICVFKAGSISKKESVRDTI